MLLTDFKNTVDKYKATILSRDLLEACNVLGIDTSRGYSGRQVTTQLYANIKDALQVDSLEPDKISRTTLLNLQSELIYRHVLYNEEPVEYLRTLKVINDSCRPDVNFFPPFTEADKWEKAIINCKNYNSFAPDTHSILFGNIRTDYPKDFDIATSVKRLIEKGCEIEFKNSDIHIVSGLEAVVAEIDEKIKNLGGVVVIQSLLNHLNLQKKYSPRFERYFITRETSGISYDQRPQIPFGFLLNLSLKYPYENLKATNQNAILTEIIELAITISNGAYGVQHYNFWEFHFQSGETIIKFFPEIVLWDTLFSIPQCRPASALEICDNLFSFITDMDFKNALGFTRFELLSVIEEINKSVINVHFPQIIYHSKLCKSLKHIDKSKIQLILDLISHTSTVNKKYSLPSDYVTIDFWKKPLIKLGATKFLFINKSWCAPSYFEAISTPLRENFKAQKKDLDNEIGKQLETFLQSKLTTKGISFKTGDYDVDGNHGECDLLIESDKAIILIEFKKKVLTGKSKSGVDTNLFIDLSESILDAQFQAGRTEIILREKGSITLSSKDGSTQTINLNDRQIERVALTQLEYGGFHDRSIFKHFLVGLLTNSYGTYSTDKTTIAKFDKLKAKQEKWIEQYNRLCAIDKNYPKHPFFDCWFMSLPQLLEIIAQSTDNNTFYETFRKTKHVTLSTLDWYREFDIATTRLENTN